MPMHGSTGNAAPELAMPVRRAAMRDVEDAQFEVVRGPADVFRPANDAPAKPSVFKTRLAETMAGPVPPDFAFRADRPARPHFFDRREPVAGLPLTAPVFAGGLAAIAFAAFWMAGGHSLFFAPLEPVAVPEKAFTVLQSNVPAPPVIETRIDRAEIEPAASSSAFAETAAPASAEIVREQPAPARIERAGSIFMIRSGGR